MADEGERHVLVLDELIERFRILGAQSDEERDVVLAALDVRGQRERTMLEELADGRPLAHPERFRDAHALVMRAMEVVERHGHRSPELTRLKLLAPVRPAGVFLVQLVARSITSSYLSRLARTLQDLYVRREAQTAPGAGERVVLRQARLEIDRVAPGFRGKRPGFPTFLLGVVSLPVATSLGRVLGGFQHLPPWLLGLAGGVGLVVTFLGSGVILRGAAMANRRMRLALRTPLAALWETVGSCGRPPRDDSMSFAYAAVAITVAGWIVLPIAVSVIVALR